MKYIVTVDEDGNEEIFIFSKLINHDTMAEAISAIRNRMRGDWKRIHRKPVSAGFYCNGVTFGRSESLNLDSRPEDAKLVVQ